MTFRKLKRRIYGQGGMTLVEVIVSIAIFSIIMVAAGRYIIFSLNSWRSIQTTSYTISRVSNIVVVMEKEVRQADTVNVFAGIDGTEPIDKGSRVDIYTDFHGEMARITYLVYNDALYRKVTNPSEDPPNSPSDLADLIPVVPVVRSSIPIFEVDDDSKQLMIRFEVLNASGQVENLFEVNTSYTIRHQGVR